MKRIHLAMTTVAALLACVPGAKAEHLELMTPEQAASVRLIVSQAAALPAAAPKPSAAAPKPGVEARERDIVPALAELLRKNGRAAQWSDLHLANLIRDIRPDKTELSFTRENLVTLSAGKTPWTTREIVVYSPKDVDAGDFVVWSVPSRGRSLLFCPLLGAGFDGAIVTAMRVRWALEEIQNDRDARALERLRRCRGGATRGECPAPGVR